MARSLVADLSGRTATLAGTPTTPALVPTPAFAFEPDVLDELEAEFARFDGRPATADAFKAAAERARTFADAAGGGAEAVSVAALGFAADVLTAVAPEHSSLTSTCDEMVSSLSQALGIAPETAALELFLRAGSRPNLHELPPLLALEVQLRLLVALSPVVDVSLWTAGDARSVHRFAQVGGTPPTRRVRHIARAVLEGGEESSGSARGTIHGVRVLRFQKRYAVLVGRARPEDRALALAFLTEAAAGIGPVLERELLLERNAAHERELLEATEKRLLRLGFDLHDGPIQDLVALASDIRLAKDQVGEHVRGRSRKLVLGRFEDIAAQIAQLDTKLRDLSHSLEPAGVVKRPLVEVLRHEVELFEKRAGIDARLEAAGSFESLTVSQRITVYRIVQESLSNVRKHSEATDVRVSVRSREGAVEAEIADNGKGFPVEQTLISAAKRGRLGLVGIGERVRLLGGELDVDSKPGGPTVITLRLPRWQPTAGATS